jgi:hypothetical protein
MKGYVPSKLKLGAGRHPDKYYYILLFIITKNRI